MRSDLKNPAKSRRSNHSFVPVPSSSPRLQRGQVAKRRPQPHITPATLGKVGLHNAFPSDTGPFVLDDDQQLASIHSMPVTLV